MRNEIILYIERCMLYIYNTLNVCDRSSHGDPVSILNYSIYRGGLFEYLIRTTHYDCPFPFLPLC